MNHTNPPSPSPIFLINERGSHYRSLTITTRFTSILDLSTRKKIHQSKPRVLSSAKIVIRGRMLVLTVGKILSRMIKEDVSSMRARETGDRKNHEDAFDFSYYLPNFKTRELLYAEIHAWLEQLDRISKIEFILVDHSDLTRNRHPGAEWCNVPESFIVLDEASVERAADVVEKFIEYLSSTTDIIESQWLAYSVKAIYAKAAYRNIQPTKEVEAAVVTKDVLHSWLVANDIERIQYHFNKVSGADCFDTILFDSFDELIAEHINETNSDKIHPETWFQLIKIIVTIPNAFELCFSHPYALSLILDLAAMHKNETIVSMIDQSVRELGIWEHSYFKWFGYRAENLLHHKQFEASYIIFKTILQYDIPTIDLGNRDIITMFPNALFLLTKQHGLKLSKQEIDFFVQRCVIHAPNCAAIYANAGLLKIESGEYQEAFEMLHLALTTPKPAWPIPNVKIHESAYTNVLWLLLKVNSGLNILPVRKKYILEQCVQHGEKNPPIYTNAMLVCIELNEFENARRYFRLSKALDNANYNAVLSEIMSDPQLESFRDFVTTVSNNPSGIIDKPEDR